jgi:hypothetical protein
VKVLRYVSFDGPYGKEGAGSFEDGGIPDAARVIAAALTAAGIPHSEPSNRGDWAYDLTAQQDGQEIELIVASTDDERPFVVSIEGKAGVFAGKVAKDALPGAHQAVCEAIHRELGGAPGVSKLRWWTESQWDAESGWTERP